MLEEALRALLLGDPGVTDLVARRVDWNVRPQGAALPAVVLHRISGAPRMGVQGPDRASATIVQIDCWAATYPAAKALVRAVQARLAGYRGGGFQGVFIEAGRDSFEDADPDPIHRASLDIRAWYRAP